MLGLLPGLWFISMFVAISRFLSCQFHFMAPACILSFTLILHVILCHIFINKLGMGINGLILSTNFTYFVDYMMIVFYCLFESSVYEYFSFVQIFDHRVFENLCTFLALTLPSAIMLMFRFCALEVLVFISAWRSEAELNASIIAVLKLGVSVMPAYALATVY